MQVAQSKATKRAVTWLRTNLFSSPLNTLTTIVCLFLILWIVPKFLDWAVVQAAFGGNSRVACREIGSGACWGFVKERYDLFAFGFYPREERWRPVLALVLLVPAVFPIVSLNIRKNRLLLWFSISYPFLAGWLLLGGLGLVPVSTDRFGGFLLTLVVGITGISLSLPTGILLALGRRSSHPVMRILSTICIEFIRGVPLIALLFVASTMLNYFLPAGSEFDLLLRVLIMVTLFAAAYMAEVIRGAIEGVAAGQTEAGQALGLGYWQIQRMIVLPQALKISIPGIVNVFIGLFKDTTLVIVIGLLDPLGMRKPILSDPKWNGLAIEVYVFVALFFFICCFGMSRYSQAMEKKLGLKSHR